MVQDEVVPTAQEFQGLRRAMVDNQIRTFDVTDQRVLEMFYVVPREKFVPAHLESLAYSDAPLTLRSSQPGTAGRVLLLPLFLARIIQSARPVSTQRAMVVGSENGYAAAILAGLVRSVVALESDAGFCETAAAQLSAAGHGNVQVVAGPLPEGHKAGGPYDLILVNGAVEGKLDALFEQIAPNGCLVTVEAKSGSATRRSAKAVRYDKIAGQISRRDLFNATVPVLPEFVVPQGFVF